MNGLTRFVLKRPITTLMAVLCLIVFGYTSVTSMSLENIPDMEMPVLMVMTTYSGASPEDVNEIITKPIEDQVGTLSGLKSVTSNSSEGSSMVMLEYEYIHQNRRGHLHLLPGQFFQTPAGSYLLHKNTGFPGMYYQ